MIREPVAWERRQGHDRACRVHAALWNLREAWIDAEHRVTLACGLSYDCKKQNSDLIAQENLQQSDQRLVV
jgi:hypothetical protein